MIPILSILVKSSRKCIIYLFFYLLEYIYGISLSWILSCMQSISEQDFVHWILVLNNVTFFFLSVFLRSLHSFFLSHFLEEIMSFHPFLKRFPILTTSLRKYVQCKCLLFRSYFTLYLKMFII